MRISLKRFAAGAAIVSALLVLSPIVATASTFLGSITLTAPTNWAPSSGTVGIWWAWKKGTYVTSTSTVDVYYAPVGAPLRQLVSGVPIKNGFFGISTPSPAFPDGQYRFQVFVHGKPIHSNLGSALIDNSAPSATITDPAEQDVTVLGMPVGSLVTGTTTLSLDATDAGSGVDPASITWSLDDIEIAAGNGAAYDFSGVSIGDHILTASVSDLAGNETMVSEHIFAAPFAATIAPTTPTLPPLPSMTVGPTIDPSDVPVPTDTPTAVPTPTDTPSDVPTPTDTPTPPGQTPPPLPLPSL